MRIILASGSPRRKELLGRMFKDFDVIPSSFEEDNDQDIPPFELAVFHAIGKALDVAATHPDDLVIGADTFVVFKDHILGKPKDRDDARRMLTYISGQEVDVVTGVCVIMDGQKHAFHEVTKLHMTKISESEIDAYLNKEVPLDKAGAFSAQGLGSIFIEKVEGCYFNVIGLPLHHLYRLFKKIGIDVL